MNSKQHAAFSRWASTFIENVETPGRGFNPALPILSGQVLGASTKTVGFQQNPLGGKPDFMHNHRSRGQYNFPIIV
jgi:hypothetical protein